MVTAQPANRVDDLIHLPQGHAIHGLMYFSMFVSSGCVFDFEVIQIQHLYCLLPWTALGCCTQGTSRIQIHFLQSFPLCDFCKIIHLKTAYLTHANFTRHFLLILIFNKKLTFEKVHSSDSKHKRACCKAFCNTPTLILSSQKAGCHWGCCILQQPLYHSTVTDFARFLGLSTSQPRLMAT